MGSNKKQGVATCTGRHLQGWCCGTSTRGQAVAGNCLKEPKSPDQAGNKRIGYGCTGFLSCVLRPASCVVGWNRRKLTLARAWGLGRIKVTGRSEEAKPLRLLSVERLVCVWHVAVSLDWSRGAS